MSPAEIASERGRNWFTRSLAGGLAVALVTFLACGDDSANNGTSGTGGAGAGGSGGTGAANTGGGGAGASGTGGGAGAVPEDHIIPADQKIPWQPGVPGGIPDVSVVCPSGAPSVTDFGAVGNGTTDDYAAFEAALNAATEGSAIRIPTGDYLLSSGLLIDKGVVLCGEGPELSRLLFDTSGVAIEIVIYDRGDFVAVTAGHDKGSTELTVADGSSFVVGQYAELQQTNDWAKMDPENVWQNESWVPEDCVGQMFEVMAINGDTLTVEPALHLDYDATFDPVIRRMGLVEGAGLQGLYLTRLDTNDAATVQMKNAVASWIRDCESENTFRAHVTMSSALWCEVRDSHMHYAHDYGGGGHGYGTTLGNHVTASLIENNIFVHLRHSMMVQVGATGNVFGYNYSIDPYANGGGWSPCDISLHGHYPNMNLFEGNTVQELDVSDYWGPCGPGNTFFRNRTEAEGIQVMDYSHRQNVVGNELSTAPNVIVIESNVDDTLVHGNYENGGITFDPQIEEQTLLPSLYHPSKPAFFGSTDWPATGGDLAPNGGTIPAQQRYESM